MGLCDAPDDVKPEPAALDRVGLRTVDLVELPEDLFRLGC